MVFTLNKKKSRERRIRSSVGVFSAAKKVSQPPLTQSEAAFNPPPPLLLRLQFHLASIAGRSRLLGLNLFFVSSFN